MVICSVKPNPEQRNLLIHTFLQGAEWAFGYGAEFACGGPGFKSCSGTNSALCVVVFYGCAVMLINIPCSFNTIQGGSVGKGTAVKDNADIDCVVFLNNVKTMEEHKRKLKETKTSLETCLKQSPYKGEITLDGQTPNAVKFKFRLECSQEFDIDLLPTFTTNQSQGKIDFHLPLTQPEYAGLHCLSAM